MEVKMRVEKKVLNDALRILGKVVCQTSPVELYRSIRFTGDENGAMAMATDSVEMPGVLCSNIRRHAICCSTAIIRLRRLQKYAVSAAGIICQIVSVRYLE